MSHPSGRRFSLRKIASVVILALGQGKDKMPPWSPFQPYFSALFSLWFWESVAWAGTPLCWALCRCGTKPAPPQGEEFRSKYKMGDEGLWGSVATASVCVMSCASLVSCCAGGSDAMEVSSLSFFFFLTWQWMSLYLKKDTERVQWVFVGIPSSLRCSWNQNNPLQDVFPAIQPLLIISIAPNSTSFCCSSSSFFL